MINCRTPEPVDILRLRRSSGALHSPFGPRTHWHCSNTLILKWFEVILNRIHRRMRLLRKSCLGYKSDNPLQRYPEALLVFFYAARVDDGRTFTANRRCATPRRHEIGSDRRLGNGRVDLVPTPPTAPQAVHHLTHEGGSVVQLQLTKPFGVQAKFRWHSPAAGVFKPRLA